MDRDEWLRIFDEKHELLNFIGANTVPKAKAKLGRERKEFEETKNQLKQVVDALEVDNWRNGVVRAKSLLKHLEKTQFPQWLLTISPHWIDKVSPSTYKSWLRFCQEQFLVALSSMQSEKERFPDYDIEEDLNVLKKAYLHQMPGEFIKDVSNYISVEDDDEGGLE
jgi:hypothetical protein